MKKIVLLGPECTGKTTLAMKLAEKHGGAFVPEYSRPYTEAVRRQGRDIGLEDVVPIVRGQLAGEEAAGHHASLLFLDGNPLAEAVYSRWYYHRLPEDWENAVEPRPYDFYLLCYPDLEWVPDPARDMPVGREDIFVEFEKAVADSGVPYGIVRGYGDKRLENAENLLRGQELLP